MLAFFSLFILMPPAVSLGTEFGATAPRALRFASLVWPAMVAAGFWYANRRCGDPRQSYLTGLSWITQFTMTGWTYLSFATVMPALLAAFLGSVAIAIVGDIRRAPSYAPARWWRLVGFFYRHRMVQ